ncbi:GFA family protein [uncultured Alsobacter sp.]|uniref:GFA family protein n=1 Tax=uncultured Alsobacter sp. TaxID=1748258 RepID=UPI0025D8334F|nr:GFA family protein [uncultured Alsobacter sp.]
MADGIQDGGCLCGAVRFRVTGPLREIVACHCSMCRRATGTFVAATAAADADMVVTGADTLTWFRSSDEAERGFCRQCGSNLFWRRPGSGRTSILAGSLDQPTGLAIARHIFVADKGDFYEIGDEAPRHDAW